MTIKTLQVGPIMTNCYLLCDEDAKVCALIDPGDDAARVEKLVEQSGCALKYILLTHGHFDHVGGVKEIAAETGCTLLDYEWNDSCITDDDTQFFDGFHLDEKYGLPDWTEELFTDIG